MNCEDVKKQLTEDLLRRLDEKVDLHLRSCSECRHLCEDLLVLEKMAQSLADEHKVPSGFGSRILAEAARSGSSKFSRFKPVLLALVLVMLSVGFFWMKDGSKESDGFVPNNAVGQFGAGIRRSEETQDSSYVEVIVQDPAEGDLILRLPSVIEIRQTDLHENFYFEDVSY